MDVIFLDLLFELYLFIFEEIERFFCLEKKSFGENNSFLYIELLNIENFLFLNLVFENIIWICIEFYFELMFRL